MTYLGDYTLEDTIDFKFTTRDPTTMAPFALQGGAVAAYVGNSVTQITAGITLTTNFDGIEGLNHVRIVATNANGYASGSDYDIVITSGVVDSVSVVGEVIGRFTLSRSAAAVDLANGTDGLTALKAVIDSILVDTGTTLDGKIDAILVDTGTSLPADIAALDNVVDAVGALVTAVKAKTDQLTFGVTNTLNSNVEYVNGIEVIGSGTTASPWRPTGT
jgi:hypothetical protein